MKRDWRKIWENTIKTAIVALTFVLVWFTGVYYPSLVNKYKSQPVHGVIGEVEASATGLPYSNSHFSINYDSSKNTYVIDIRALTVDQYNQYQSEAVLVLKNILSMESVCHLNLIFTSNLPYTSSQKAC